MNLSCIYVPPPKTSMPQLEVPYVNSICFRFGNSRRSCPNWHHSFTQKPDSARSLQIKHYFNNSRSEEKNVIYFIPFWFAFSTHCADIVSSSDSGSYASVLEISYSLLLPSVSVFESQSLISSVFSFTFVTWNGILVLRLNDKSVLTEVSIFDDGGNSSWTRKMAYCSINSQQVFCCFLSPVFWQWTNNCWAFERNIVGTALSFFVYFIFITSFELRINIPFKAFRSKMFLTYCKVIIFWQVTYAFWILLTTNLSGFLVFAGIHLNNDFPSILLYIRSDLSSCLFIHS